MTNLDAVVENYVHVKVCLTHSFAVAVVKKSQKHEKAENPHDEVIEPNTEHAHEIELDALIVEVLQIFVIIEYFQLCGMMFRKCIRSPACGDLDILGTIDVIYNRRRVVDKNVRSLTVYDSVVITVHPGKPCLIRPVRATPSDACGAGSRDWSAEEET